MLIYIAQEKISSSTKLRLRSKGCKERLKKEGFGKVMFGPLK